MADDKADSAKCLRSGSDYKTHFDAKKFLETYFDMDHSTFFRRDFEMLHKLVAAETIPDGGRLLDVASGPCIHAVISAGSRCSEIVCSDFAAQNRDEIVKWVNGEPDAHNWEPIFQYICRLEGKSEEWKTRQEHIRQAIKQVIPCDVTHENPLAPQVFEPFDVITACFVLEAACPTEQSFMSAVKNMASLLKPGGLFIMSGALGGSFYTVGKEQFERYPASKELTERAFAEAGLTNLRWHKHSLDVEASDKKLLDRPTDATGLYAVCARKHQQ